MKTIFLMTLMVAAAIFSIPASAGVIYSYDSAGRVIGANYGNGTTIGYTYDAAGNLIGRAVSGGAQTAGTITSVTTAFAPASSGIAQNTWTVIKGTNLVPSSTPAAGVTWSTAASFAQGLMPTQLNGIGVTINGKPGYIYFYCSAATSTICTSDQINVLSPFDSTLGPVQVFVTNGTSVTLPFAATLETLVPSLFNFDGSHIVATHLNNSIVGPATLYPGLSTPASPGEQIVVYATGFGLPPTALTPGSASQFGSLPTLPVCSIGSNAASLAFAGLVSPGLVQMNINIPANSASGDLPISCTFAGATTPSSNVVTVQ